MGMYHTLMSKDGLALQVKVGVDGMEWVKGVKEGESVAKLMIPDGVYIAYEGVAVIKDQTLVAVFPHLVDKWGKQIATRDVIEARNPMLVAMKEVEQNYKK
ncbi:MAG: hypothetical protein ABH983_04245 [Candidatus Micrarchaeota archaeon]